MNSGHRVAVVTGAGSGLGLLAAKRLSAAGWRVAAVDLAVGRLQEALPEALAIECDVADRESVARAADVVRRELGHPSRLLTSAGIAVLGRIGDVDPSRYEDAMRVNYLGTVSWVHEVLPAMREMGRGDIALFASLAGWIVTPGYSAYAATKWAVVGYAETLAMELADTRINVRCVCPQVVRTPMLDSIVAQGHDRRRVELSRPLTPERVIVALERSLTKPRSTPWVFPTPSSRAMWRLRRYAPRLVNALSVRLGN